MLNHRHSLCVFVILLPVHQVFAQDDEDAEALAKAAQNPIANMIGAVVRYQPFFML